MGTKSLLYKKVEWKYQLVTSYQRKLPVHMIFPFGQESIITPYLKLEDDVITLSKGYAWDGPSGPSIDTKNFMAAAAVHDALYQLIGYGFFGVELWQISRARMLADKALRKICLEDGMSRFRAWYVWKAVRFFGGKWATKKSNLVLSAP